VPAADNDPPRGWFRQERDGAVQKKTTTKVRAVTVAVIRDALDKAWENVQASGARFEGNAEDARTLLAKHIVDLALLGERNRDRLINGALARFKLQGL